MELELCQSAPIEGNEHYQILDIEIKEIFENEEQLKNAQKALQMSQTTRSNTVVREESSDLAP